MNVYGPWDWWLACELSGKRSGADRNRLERSGAVRSAGFKKIKWSVSGAGGRLSGNEAMSGSPLNGAVRWAGSFVAPLSSLALDWCLELYSCCSNMSIFHLSRFIIAYFYYSVLCICVLFRPFDAIAIVLSLNISVLSVSTSTLSNVAPMYVKIMSLKTHYFNIHFHTT